MAKRESFEHFFSSLGIGTVACTLLVSIGKVCSQHYFFYIMIIFVLILILLLIYPIQQQQQQQQQQQLTRSSTFRSCRLFKPRGSMKYVSTKSLGRTVRSKGGRRAASTSHKALAWKHRRIRSEPGATNEDLLAMEIFTGSTDALDDIRRREDEPSQACGVSRVEELRRDTGGDENKKLNKELARKNSVIRTLVRRISSRKSKKSSKVDS